MSHGDPELEARVLEAFNNDPVLSERAIEIGSSAGGSIVLSGWVYTDGEVEYATTIARGVPGVMKVTNRLGVRIDDPRATAEARNGEAPAAE
jgi:osmotically-inducible protein OsmY